MVYIWQWFSGKNLSLNYGDITVSATCTTDDSETLEYDISIEQHEANGVQDGSAEYANVSSANVSMQHCFFNSIVYLYLSQYLCYCRIKSPFNPHDCINTNPALK